MWDKGIQAHFYKAAFGMINAIIVVRQKQNNTKTASYVILIQSLVNASGN